VNGDNMPYATMPRHGVYDDVWRMVMPVPERGAQLVWRLVAERDGARPRYAVIATCQSDVAERAASDGEEDGKE